MRSIPLLLCAVLLGCASPRLTPPLPPAPKQAVKSVPVKRAVPAGQVVIPRPTNGGPCCVSWTTRYDSFVGGMVLEQDWGCLKQTNSYAAYVTMDGGRSWKFIAGWSEGSDPCCVLLSWPMYYSQQAQIEVVATGQVMLSGLLLQPVMREGQPDQMFWVSFDFPKVRVQFKQSGRR